MRRAGQIVARLVLLVVLFATPHAAHAAVRTYEQRRVDELSTAALLHRPAAALVDPNRQRAASLIAELQRPLFFLGFLAPSVAFWWLWRSGRAAAVRDAMRRTTRSTWLLRFWYGAFLATLATFANTPFRFIAYRVSYAAGLTTEPVAAWCLTLAAAFAAAAAYAGIAVAVIFWFVDRTRLWYLWAIAFIIVLVTTSAVLQPVTVGMARGEMTPLHDPAHARLYARVAHRLEIAEPPLLVAPAHRGVFGRADVEGLGPTNRIVIGQPVIASDSPAELAFTIVRLETKVARHDALRLIMVATFLFIVAVALAVTISDRSAFRRDDDALSRLAFVGALMGLIVLVLYPGYAAYVRGMERDADRDTVLVIGRRADGIRSLVRYADERFVPICPTPLDRVFSLQVAVGDRIAALQGVPSPCR